MMESDESRRKRLKFRSIGALREAHAKAVEAVNTAEEALTVANASKDKPAIKTATRTLSAARKTRLNFMPKSLDPQRDILSYSVILCSMPLTDVFVGGQRALRLKHSVFCQCELMSQQKVAAGLIQDTRRDPGNRQAPPAQLDDSIPNYGDGEVYDGIRSDDDEPFNGCDD